MIFEAMDERVAKRVAKRNQEAAARAAQEQAILAGNDVERTLAERERDLEGQPNAVAGDN